MNKFSEEEHLFSAEDEVYHVQNEIRNSAISATNQLCFPIHKIWTDANGVVINVTNGFLNFTGYERNDMIGRKCNFLQGKDTDSTDVRTIRKAIAAKQETCVVILNYCKNGNPFWNVLTILPVYNASHELVSFSSTIVGLRIPPQMRNKPRLCLTDAMALINVFSAIPSTISLKFETLSVDSETVSTDEERSLFKHINYSTIGTKEPIIIEETVDFIAETNLPTEKGVFRMRAYRNNVTGAEPLALIHGNVRGKKAVLCRVHDQCVTSEVFGSVKCDCKQQLDYALNEIKTNSPGIVFYLPQEGRGIGIANKVAAYALQESGFDTVDANRELGLPDDAREYACVPQILADLNVKSIRLMTNNPRKIDKLSNLGVTITERVECICTPNSPHSRHYVSTKAERMGHMIDMKH